MLDDETSIKFIFFVNLASDKYEAIFADKVDLPEPELPNTKIFFDFNNLEKSFEASFFESSLKMKLYLPLFFFQ